MLRVKTLEKCDFPVVEKADGDFRMLVMPARILRHFRDEGYHAVRIASADIATMLPDFGGGTNPGHSQIPHQDLAPTDHRRFIAFSKTDWEPRGSATYLVHPETVRKTLPSLLDWFEEHREGLLEQFVYRPPYMVSKEILYQCFELGGLVAAVATLAGRYASDAMELFVYMGLLTYLTQGAIGDEVVESFLDENRGKVVMEEWNAPCVLIVDNAKIFHGRYGQNVPLRRNWLVER